MATAKTRLCSFFFESGRSHQAETNFGTFKATLTQPLSYLRSYELHPSKSLILLALLFATPSPPRCHHEEHLTKTLSEASVVSRMKRVKSPLDFGF